MVTIREKMYVMLGVVVMSVIPEIGLSQIINIVNDSTFSVAGNGSTNVGVNYGEIKIDDGSYNYNYVSPSSYGGNNDSNNNIINVSARVHDGIYGGVNYPFVNSPVAGGATDVAIIPNITANNNTVNINSRMNNDVNIYGGYSVLSDAIRNIVPSGKSLSSPISMSGNTINVNAQCDIDQEVYGAYLGLDPRDDESNAITVRSPINMDNNTININSILEAEDVYGAYVNLYNDFGTNIDIPYISMSGNTININSRLDETEDVYGAYVNLYNDFGTNIDISYISMSRNTINVNAQCYIDDVYGAYLSGFYGSTNISTVTAANNTIILSKSDLSLPDSNLYGVYYEVPSDVVENYDVHDNALYINNAKNVGVKSIHGFDVYRFDLPNNVNDNDTVLTINNQNDPVVVDAQKISINNYDHHTSILNVNLIDLYGGGKLYLLNTNGSYLYHTSTELQVTPDNMLRFTFNPGISDPDPDQPSSVALDPQTKVISEAGAANLTFVTQGLDLVLDKALSLINTKQEHVDASGVIPFAAAGASKAKYHTDSHYDNIDTNGFNVIAGIAKHVNLLDKRVALAAFFEHGNGKLETANYFSHEVDDYVVAGTGHANYNGGGILAKVNLPHNLYVDVTGRIGNARSDYYTSDLTKLSHFSFEYSTTYYGAMACLGHIYKINEYLKVDSYGKYCLTNLAGKETSLPENQSVKFDSEHMQKVKIGSRIIHEVESKDKRSSSVFMGCGFEYYLHNDFNASIMSKRVEAPEIGGGCGVIEAGFVTCIGNVNVDLCASYCNGRAKDSVDGTLKFMYAIGSGGRGSKEEEKEARKRRRAKEELKGVVYYGFDKEELSKEAEDILDENVKYLKKNPKVKVIVEGHADERGTREYNMKVGKKRAEKVKEYYVREGIKGSRIKVETYGEDKPADSARDEEGQSKNRRVVTRVVGSKKEWN